MDNMFFVANKIDTAFAGKEDELNETLPFWENQIKNLLQSEKDIKIYPLVAQDALNGDGKDTGFHDFKLAFENFLTSDEKATEIINPPINTVLSILSTFNVNIQVQLDGMQFSSEEFERKIAKNIPKLERIRKRKKELIDYISNKQELLSNKLDIEIERFIELCLNDISTAILEWDSEIKELEQVLPQLIKESLAEQTHLIQEYISEEISDIVGETASRYQDFLEDLCDFQSSFTQSTNTQNNLNKSDSLTSSENFDVGNIAMQIGGALGIGWLSSLLLGGPISWVVAIGGSMLLGGILSEKRRQAQLQKLTIDIRNKLKTELQNTAPQIKSKMAETFINFRENTENQMNALLQSVENTINGIKQNMELEQDKIERKRDEYIAIQKQINEQEKWIIIIMRLIK